MKIYDMKVNYQVDPLGIDLEHVVFSWKVTGAVGRRQKSAVLLIAEDEKFQHVVYDSHGSEIHSFAHVPEVELEAGKPYYWTVTVMDELGNTAVSAPAVFEGGHPQEGWHGIWIEPPFDRNVAPMMRQYFTVEEDELVQLKSARLYICGLGVYEVYLNGEKVGDEYLTPYYTDYRFWIQYQTYDVGRYLRAGENRIDVHLGDGWYKGRFGYTNNGLLREYYGDEFKLLADLYLTYRYDTERIFGTDESWLALKSPVLASGIYDGEIYDARKESVLEHVPDRQLLHAVEAEAPKGKLCAMIGVPVKRREVLKVKEVITSEAGETILDFGQEITGWVVFQADLPTDAKVKLYYSEIMQDGRFYRDNLRTATAEYEFISAGKKQLARPHFTFYGFRYVKVDGMKVDEENKDLFEAWALYSDIPETGTLKTSHEKVNRLISNTRWSQKDNFLDIPTDCPQRDERLGWTGDAQIFAAAASYHMLTPAFFRKYLKDMRYEQEQTGGAVPYVVPDLLSIAREKNGEPEFDVSKPEWGEAGSCVWGDAATIIPWTMYQHYGNLEWLREQYGNMKQWTDFIITMDENHCGGKRVWDCGFHFGDWLSLDAEGGSREGGTDKYYVATLSYMHSAQLTALAAKKLGYDDDWKYYGQAAGEVRAAARERYVKKDGTLTIRTQTAYVLAIWFKLFDEAEIAGAADELCQLLKDNDMRLSTGFVGTAYLCQTLSAAGHADMAYTLLLNEEYPGWLYEVNLGATTIWERWNSLLPDGSISSTGMNSLNHYAYGSIVEWIYSRICGLKIDPSGIGPKYIEFAPQPDRRLEFVEGSYDTMAGEYRADWKWHGDRVVFHLTVPFDCQARLCLDEKWQNVTVDGKPIDEAAPDKVLGMGVYEIEAVL